ncbi:glycosyl hydrolase 53 family protein [Mesoplasma florum]|uniref:glycosyl hydrolase 53 family protein n=1 Tax=Mesoplasma florum TaxID=2151 RepID=UPI000BE3FFCC|nr:glycosyl hydrolase 53 family protein [Mesoplasma florum]ATI74197.1 hypothetical protein CQZ70_03050 [Mesoplasma florum]AVN61207.1 hypothetical protein CG005_02890 [Mesoplasma florum]
MKFKNIIFIFIIFISFILSLVVLGCGINNLSTLFPENGNKITNEKFIKGVDISSYAEVIEQSTWNNGEVKSFKDISDEEQKIYYNFNGEKENLFKIFSDNDINSIRLRVWNDPYDQNGKSYGGGHNDIETDAWIANQAKKFGIQDVLLDFHYSDFWADPSRQWMPKEWINIKNEDELGNAIYKYTFNSLIYFWEETNLIPTKVQIGNEITNGSFWGWNNENHKDYDFTSRMLKNGFRAVEDFEKFVNQKVKKSIHIDGNMTIKRWKLILDNYLLKNDLIKFVDEIGITHYPDWNGTAKDLFDVMSFIKKEYKLNSFVAETAATSTFNETNLVGDISSSQHIPSDYHDKPDSGTQIKLINSIMHAASNALPDDETGIYWWEPAWLLKGKTGWANREGIYYSEPNNEEKQKTFKTGNSWWNSGMFSSEGKPLLVLNSIKNYKRLELSDNKISLNDITSKNIFKDFKNDPVQNNMKIKNFSKQLNIKDWIDCSNLEISGNVSDLEIFDLFKIKNPRILEEHIKFDNIKWFDSFKSGEMQISSSSKNKIYKDFKIIIPFKVFSFEENTFNFDKKINICANDEDWLESIIENIDESEISSFMYESIKPELFTNDYYKWCGKVNNNSLAFYDEQSGFNRFLNVNILKSNNTKIFKNKKVDYEYLKNNSLEWKSKLDKGEYKISLVFTKNVNFDLYGLENWKDLGGFAINVNLNVF